VTQSLRFRNWATGNGTLFVATLQRGKQKKKLIAWDRVCIMFYIRGSVHRNSRLQKSNEMQQYAYIYLLLNYSTCFGRPSRPSSGVHKTVVAASGMDHTIGSKLPQTWPNKDAEEIQRDGTVCRYLLLLNYTTCFGRPSRPSSGVYKTVVASSGTDHTTWVASFLR